MSTTTMAKTTTTNNNDMPNANNTNMATTTATTALTTTNTATTALATTITTITITDRNIALSTAGAKIRQTSSFNNKPHYDFGAGSEAWVCSSDRARENLLQPRLQSSTSCEPQSTSADANRFRLESRYAYSFTPEDLQRTIAIDLGQVYLLNAMAAKVQLTGTRRRSELRECAFDVAFRFKRVGKHTHAKEWSRFRDGQLLFDPSLPSQRVQVLTQFLRRPGHAGISARYVQVAFPASPACRNASLSPLRLYVYGHKFLPSAKGPISDSEDNDSGTVMALIVIIAIVLVVAVPVGFAVWMVRQRMKRKFGDSAKFSSLRAKGEDSAGARSDFEADTSSDAEALGEGDVVDDDVEVVSMHAIRDEIERRESTRNVANTTPGPRDSESSSDEELSPFRDRN